jgi:Uma2 family endonuclease
MSIAEALLTAEEYALLPDRGRPTELVRGKIVEMSPPLPRLGQIGGKINRIVGTWSSEHDLGHLVSNDSAIITKRDPDTVRGADVAFYSYARMPRGPFPQGYLSVVPELVFEVRSPSDRWISILAKVVEYLDAGVSVVCVLDPGPQTIHVYRADQPAQLFSENDELVLPDVLGDFRATVRRFFE